jgi:succinate-acetate transporter protein
LCADCHERRPLGAAIAPLVASDLPTLDWRRNAPVNALALRSDSLTQGEEKKNGHSQRAESQRAGDVSGECGDWIPANPAPLGLMGFGTTTLVLSLMNANLVNFDKNLPVVLGMALAFGGLGQLLAGMWEFRTGNTFGAVAFTAYGAFWISFYFLVQVQLPAIIKGGDLGSALGLYLWAWGIFTGMLFLCTFASPRAVQAIFLLLTVTFILLGIGNSGGTASIIHAGGWFGIATARPRCTRDRRDHGARLRTRRLSTRAARGVAAEPGATGPQRAVLVNTTRRRGLAQASLPRRPMVTQSAPGPRGRALLHRCDSEGGKRWLPRSGPTSTISIMSSPSCSRSSGSTRRPSSASTRS